MELGLLEPDSSPKFVEKIGCDMIIDARSLANDHTINTDICIVGAGVAGITLARELATWQFRICILESGGLKAEKETQSLYQGENVGHPYYPLDTARGRQFGGSSSRWLLELGEGRIGGRLHPLSQIDFDQRDWVPYSGWPFDKTHLDPYYERAQSVCKAGPYSYDAKDWEDKQRNPTLPLVGGRVKTVIYQGVDRDVFGKDYKGELVQADDITVYLHANVLEVETSENGQRVTRLRVACLHGNEFWATAKIFVLAVGGIETPRLLLLSNKTYSTGLGNQNDLVGRFFMEHPHLWSGLFIPSDPGVFRSAMMYGVHIVKSVPIIGQLTLEEDVMRREKLLNYSVCLLPGARPRTSGGQRALTTGIHTLQALAGALGRRDLNEFNRHLSTLFPVVNNLSIAAYRRAMRVMNKLFKVRKFEVFLLNHMVEQVPNPNSRVSLGNERDAFGQNRVRLDWRLTPIDIRSIIRSQEIIDEELRQAGLGSLLIDLKGETPPPELHGGWHHMGTTRMHIDPKKGVVNENLQVHGLSNLYIAGPSVFPTSGCANPALTIVALTLRLADHLKKVMK